MIMIAYYDDCRADKSSAILLSVPSFRADNRSRKSFKLDRNSNTITLITKKSFMPPEQFQGLTYDL